MLELTVKPTNSHDQFATAVIKPDGTVVSHISNHASKADLFSLRKAGSAALCEVTGRCWPWTENSVQLHKFYGRQAYVDRLQTLIIAIQTTFYTDRY